MPELCRFYGIVIRMFYDDHAPPHFHVVYGDLQAVIAIETLAVIAGEVPPRALGLVVEWASIRRGELLDAWQRAHQGQMPGKIEPLY
ncbi:MAG: DUF4160 domain-containing protein [Planctomycetaceae bacterium]|nr:DUF4160 domain-containing protein [Planctomycetaceae bacterium]